MEKQLIEEISDGVATLTFNRPDRLNATFDTEHERLARSAAPTGADAAVGVIVPAWRGRE
jgi:enoyl-CoA hydratase/carnithine racemase